MKERDVLVARAVAKAARMPMHACANDGLEERTYAQVQTPVYACAMTHRRVSSKWCMRCDGCVYATRERRKDLGCIEWT